MKSEGNKMRHRKSIVSVILVLTLLAVPLTSLSAFELESMSADTIGQQSPTGYAMIKDAQGLSNIRNNLSGKYYLANDIIFGEEDSFTPIGTEAQPFKGILDGNGQIIYGLQTMVNAPGTVYSGLFGYVSGGSIKNLGVNGVTTAISTTATAYAGGIAAYLDSSSSITNCHSSAIVSATSLSSVHNVYDNAYAGGIAGYATSPISYSYSTASVSASLSTSYNSIYDYTFAGGIAGYTSGSIINCYNAATITSTSTENAYAGGIAGYAKSTISICYNTATVSSASSSFNAYAGGIAGYTSGSISICYNTAAVSVTTSTTAYAGGIAGSVSGHVRDSYNTGDVSATVRSNNAHAGGIAGEMNYAPYILNCYTTGKITAISRYGVGYVGAIAGICLSISKQSVINCYALRDQLYRNDYLFSNVICLSDTIAHDGMSTPERGATQWTSAEKTMEMMTVSSLSAALANESMYYTGMTGTRVGWDFNEIWTINGTSDDDARINEGMPILRAFYFNVSADGPTDQVISEGETVIFLSSVSISPDESLIGCRWQVSEDIGLTWNDVPNAHMPDLVIKNASASLDGNMYRLAITIPGYNDTTIFSEPAMLTVIPLFTVSGTVTYEGTWMTGSVITYTIDDGTPLTKAIDDGGYSITTEIGKTINITKVEKTGYSVDATLPTSFTASETMDFIMNMTFFEISGRVVSGDNGIEGVTISYSIDNGNLLSMSTDANGDYSIKVQIGKTVRIMSVTHLKYVGIYPSLYLTEDNVSNFTMINAVFKVHGKIITDGNGVEGAELTYTIDNGQTKIASTDSSGNYSITANVGETVTITGIKGVKMMGQMPSPFTSGGTASFEITYERESPSNIISSFISNRFLIFALIGAAVGAVIGLMWYIMKRKP